MDDLYIFSSLLGKSLSLGHLSNLFVHGRLEVSYDLWSPRGNHFWYSKRITVEVKNKVIFEYKLEYHVSLEILES